MRYDTEARDQIKSGDLLAWSHERWGNKSGVYEIVNTINGKRYIGSAKHLKGRKDGHQRGLSQGTHHAVALQRAYNKYGANAFLFRPLLICKPELLLFYEQLCFDKLLPQYNSSPTAGSQIGFRHSHESRQRMSSGQRRRMPPSAETRAKTSAALLGKKKSPQHAAKIRVLRVGTTFTEEQKKKMSLSHMGVLRGPHTEEHKKKIAAALRGKSHSPERRAAIRAGRWG